MIQGVLLRWIITAVCMALFALGRVRYMKQACKAERFRASAVQVLLGILVLAQLWFVTWLSLYKSWLGWDGLVVWEAKATIAFQYNGVLPLQYFTGGDESAHVSYPLFFSLLQLLIFDVLRPHHLKKIKIIRPFFFFFLGVLLFFFVKSFCPTPF